LKVLGGVLIPATSGGIEKTEHRPLGSTPPQRIGGLAVVGSVGSTLGARIVDLLSE
jgi:hypothetical protein